MTLYLAYAAGPDDEPRALEYDDDGFELAPGLYLFDSELSRSKLYHRLKWSDDEIAGLLVAPLDDAPKFMGMAPGALKWVRQRRS